MYLLSIDVLHHFHSIDVLYPILMRLDNKYKKHYLTAITQMKHKKSINAKDFTADAISIN